MRQGYCMKRIRPLHAIPLRFGGGPSEKDLVTGTSLAAYPTYARLKRRGLETGRQPPKSPTLVRMERRHLRCP